MIVTKKRFNLTPGYRGKWPFTVPEVTVMIILDKDKTTALFVLVHRFGGFALSGVLEHHGYDQLESSGIWANAAPEKRLGNIGPVIEPAIKRSLTPFFAYIQAMAVRELGGGKDEKA